MVFPQLQLRPQFVMLLAWISLPVLCNGDTDLNVPTNTDVCLSNITIQPLPPAVFPNEGSRVQGLHGNVPFHQEEGQCPAKGSEMYSACPANGAPRNYKIADDFVFLLDPAVGYTWHAEEPHLESRLSEAYNLTPVHRTKGKHGHETSTSKPTYFFQPTPTILSGFEIDDRIREIYSVKKPQGRRTMTFDGSHEGGTGKEKRFEENDSDLDDQIRSIYGVTNVHGRPTMTFGGRYEGDFGDMAQSDKDDGEDLEAKVSAFLSKDAWEREHGSEATPVQTSLLPEDEEFEESRRVLEARVSAFLAQDAYNREHEPVASEPWKEERLDYGSRHLVWSEEEGTHTPFINHETISMPSPTSRDPAQVKHTLGVSQHDLEVILDIVEDFSAMEDNYTSKTRKYSPREPEATEETAANEPDTEEEKVSAQAEGSEEIKKRVDSHIQKSYFDINYTIPLHFVNDTSCSAFGFGLLTRQTMLFVPVNVRESEPQGRQFPRQMCTPRLKAEYPDALFFAVSNGRVAVVNVRDPLLIDGERRARWGFVWSDEELDSFYLITELGEDGRIRLASGEVAIFNVKTHTKSGEKLRGGCSYDSPLSHENIRPVKSQKDVEDPSSCPAYIHVILAATTCENEPEGWAERLGVYPDGSLKGDACPAEA